MKEWFRENSFPVALFVGIPLFVVGVFAAVLLFERETECLSYAEVESVGPCDDDIECRALLADGRTVSGRGRSYVVGETVCSQSRTVPGSSRWDRWRAGR